MKAVQGTCLLGQDDRAATGSAAVPKPGLVFHLPLGETLHISDQK